MATVLVVDDLATSREIARSTLDHAGHRVITAIDGPDALQQLATDHADLVVADMLMPRMDGYGLVRELRADPATADIPVLFYTANYLPEEAEALAGAHGVAGVVPKSADPLELLSAVSAALQHRPIRLPDDLTTGLLSQHLEAVNAKLVEKVGSLHESQAKLSTVAELAPVGIVVGDADGAATYVNPRFTEITRASAGELLGTGWLRCLPSQRREDFLRPGTAEAAVPRWRVQRELADGTAQWLDVLVRHTRNNDGTPIGFVAIVDDVTAEMQAEVEERSRIAERFDSLARMAGAVAHDFNNLLNVILAFDDFVAEAIADATGTELTQQAADAIQADLEKINHAGRRAAHLAHQLLTFGGREIVESTVIDVNAVVRDACTMICSSIGRNVAVTTDLAADLRRVRADGSQLCQVLLNLAANARDAMPAGGELTIRTSNTSDNVHIEVIDSGEGMSADVAERAIEPFFTTRPKGHGEGLGLATAYGIVRQAGGELHIDSAVGSGTTVHILLPAVDEPVEAPTTPSAAPAPSVCTILLAEDEDGIREVVTRVLTGAGYHVLAAANGEEALAIAESHAGTIEVVLTDVVMPRLNGAELGQALQRTRPETPILYMSGYAAPLMTEQGLLPPGVSVLSKPFTKTQLLDAVRATLAVAPESTTRSTAT
ncbi:MAG TPA: response regulator [Actinoplanes sp.]|nr:response regulator [Actinoplanes sp.]